MFILVPNYCIIPRYRKSKKEIIRSIFILWIIIQITTNIMGNSSLGAIFLHAILLITVSIIFNEDSLGAIIAFNIVQVCIISNLIICSNSFFTYVNYNIFENYTEIANVLVMYLPQYIMTYFILKYKSKIYKVYRNIRSRSFSIFSLIIISIVIDFIMSYNGIIHDLDNPLFKEIIFILLGIFILTITIYFIHIDKKAREILKLNNSLEERINELKKFNDNCKAEISYLYRLYLMNEYEKLSDYLKGIINGNNIILSEVERMNNSNSIILDIVNGIEHRGINVIINDEIDFNDIDVSELDYQRIISNILRNAVTAMNGIGTIEIKTNFSSNFSIIKIKNDGPKIEENIIDKIFQVGVSTKANKNKDNGFGLPIVKDIVEKNGGTIEVYSDELFTEFVIKIPKK
ncbi:ATP-binding protein [Clostridium sp. D53t1_180928_C8]|uniref:sensor histidine kinase n=1 Tax=Clostridium sp. D53t1_180928_C8 TaxID=2787101 RepID=UPI0018A8A8A4|nr:ATP-binding protein [Clostridium sp. D53t1_180928_C8]